MAHAHLLLVHLPMVLLPVGALGYALAFKRAERFWLRLFEVLLFLCGLLSIAAYYTGGSAFEELRGSIWQGEAGEAARLLAEDHAVIGRAAFMLMVLITAFIGQILLARLKDTEPARWQQLLLPLLALAGMSLMLWAGALGGPIAHLELR